jgi:type IV fimbrial biogenesis protein FimT
MALVDGSLRNDIQTPMKTHTHRLSKDQAPRRLHGRGERGFTMVELMLTVAVLGILLAAGVPSFRSIILANRIKNASFDVYSSILAARSDAMTRNTTVTITPAGGTNWAAGWTATAAGPVTLKTQDALAGITVTGPATLVYNSSGRLDRTVHAVNPTISLSATGVEGRCVTIDLSGRPATTKGVCP